MLEAEAYREVCKDAHKALHPLEVATDNFQAIERLSLNTRVEFEAFDLQSSSQHSDRMVVLDLRKCLEATYSTAVLLRGIRASIYHDPAKSDAHQCFCEGFANQAELEDIAQLDLWMSMMNKVESA